MTTIQPPRQPLPELPEPARRRELRAAMGWTLQETARELGVNTRTIVRWENGDSQPRPRHHRDYHDLLTDWQEQIQYASQ